MFENLAASYFIIASVDRNKAANVNGNVHTLVVLLVMVMVMMMMLLLVLNDNFTLQH